LHDLLRRGLSLTSRSVKNRAPTTALSSVTASTPSPSRSHCHCSATSRQAKTGSPTTCES
jgi:hypothetical protein